MPRLLLLLVVLALSTGCRPSADERLFESVWDEDPAGVREALDAGADPRAVQEDEGPVIVSAVRYGPREIVAMLLDAGADPATRDEEGQGLAVLALGSCLPEIHELVIARGTPPAPPVDGLEAVLGCGSLALLDAYLENHPAEALPPGWITAIPIPDDRAGREAARARIAAWVGAHGVPDRESLDWALVQAAGAVDLPRVRMLLALGARAGADALAVACRPETHRAADATGPVADAQAELSELRSLLLASGADIDAVDARGRTALLHALEQASLDAVAFLLAHGADAAHPDEDGRTPLHVVVEANWVALALRDEASGPIGPAKAATLEALLTHGARVDAPDGRGRTPLHRAAEGAALEPVRVLLAAGADPAARDADGHTPADLARSRLPKRPGETDRAGRLMLAVTGLGALLEARLERYEAILALLGEPLPKPPQEPGAAGPAST